MFVFILLLSCVKLNNLEGKSKRFGDLAVHIYRNDLTGVTKLLNDVTIKNRQIDLSERNRNLETSLHIAAKFGNTEIVAAILEKIKNIKAVDPITGRPKENFVNNLINAVDNNGSTALFIACTQGYAHIVRLLLDAGTNPNIVRPDGKTALFVSSARGDKDIAEILLSRGADINAVTIDGLTISLPAGTCVVEGGIKNSFVD